VAAPARDCNSVEDRARIAHRRIPLWLPSWVPAVEFADGSATDAANMLEYWAQRGSMTEMSLRYCRPMTAAQWRAISESRLLTRPANSADGGGGGGVGDSGGSGGGVMARWLPALARSASCAGLRWLSSRPPWPCS
jgi:hypothetical protein